jgi:hypothetical protein
LASSCRLQTTVVEQTDTKLEKKITNIKEKLTTKNNWIFDPMDSLHATPDFSFARPPILMISFLPFTESIFMDRNIFPSQANELDFMGLVGVVLSWIRIESSK